MLVLVFYCLKVQAMLLLLGTHLKLELSRQIFHHIGNKAIICRRQRKQAHNDLKFIALEYLISFTAI